MSILNAQFDKLPFNISIMDVDSFIKQSLAKQVTSFSIKTPSSSSFDPDGLFSEEIFGRLGTIERLTQYGYFELNTTIIAPEIYNEMSRMGGIYFDVMAGKRYAIFDEKEGELVAVDGDPENIPQCGTGFTFFMKVYPKIKFKQTDSQLRAGRIEMIDKFREIGLYKRYIVSPAALRDISEDANGRLIQDDVNALYTSLLSYTQSLPPSGSDNPIYDHVKYMVQIKAVAIFNYFVNVMSGKTGFLQSSYASRRIAGGTRNVISASSFDAESIDDPAFFKYDETIMGVFQTMKSCQAQVYYVLRHLYFDPVFGTGLDVTSVPLINAKTYALEYVDIPNDEFAKFTTAEGVNKLINRFANDDIRNKPVAVKNAAGKYMYLHLVYDEGYRISLFRSLADLKSRTPTPVDMTKVRPLTWIELMYLATVLASSKDHTITTRYPVLEVGSTFVAKVKVMATDPSRKVALVDRLVDSANSYEIVFPHYPELGNDFFDTTSVHAGRLSELDGDHDGDMTSQNTLLGDDSNKECADYLNSIRSLINTQKRLIGGEPTDLITLTYHNLTK